MKLDYDMMEITLRELMRYAESAPPADTEYATGYRHAMDIVGTLASFALTCQAPDPEVDDDNLFPKEGF